MSPMMIGTHMGLSVASFIFVPRANSMAFEKPSPSESAKPSLASSGLNPKITSSTSEMPSLSSSVSEELGVPSPSVSSGFEFASSGSEPSDISRVSG